VSPFAALQLALLGIAVVVAEWCELHVGPPLQCRVASAVAATLAAVPLWCIYLGRHRSPAASP
jgi:hypothetical protein